MQAGSIDQAQLDILRTVGIAATLQISENNGKN